ncbi:tripartite tricarboxylate transporter substrate binding protein [Cupriavidus sp. DB3]|uniref:Bug family tripartite tricarboxylate transporter substrate binding protein n=1 Tax=Cupriavidus sp. DB3 TaxID=2873259 RepID=UPI001CF29ED9|nr:tripartite tricarboxylate transporter substrate binding protein [Cupriavidus sp. DB3]MCA7082391.1 tripartite tricarboxylate transporter substrate binding protein [Cupriavidus sp. DB3]
MKRRKFLVASSILMTTALPRLGAAADWPARPIRMVIGYPPGGSTDVGGRLLAEQLSSRLGQQIVVENRPGASGTIGAASVVRAEPDGYTLLLAASPEVSIAPSTMSLPYDPRRDLKPVSTVGRVPFLLVVNPAVPAKTLAEFIAYARANPGKLNYSSFGENTSNHMGGELFKRIARIEAAHVPYKGSGPSIADVIAGHIDYTLDTPPAVQEHIKAGKLRALAVALPSRLPSLPNVPTFAEAGLADFTGGTWWGLLAPAKTPDAVVARLNREVNAILQMPEVRQRYASLGAVVQGSSPEAFGRYIDAEIGKWSELAKQMAPAAKR